MNRFHSILEGVVADVVKDLRELHPKTVQDAHWSIQDNRLIAHIKGEDYEFEFEKGDPTSEAMLLILNNLHFLLTVLEQR